MRVKMGCRSRRKVRQLLLNRDGSKCYLCQDKMLPHEMSVDHVIPRENKGTNELENLRLTHPWCNESRHWKGKKLEYFKILSTDQRRKLYDHNHTKL